MEQQSRMELGNQKKMIAIRTNETTAVSETESLVEIATEIARDVATAAETEIAERLMVTRS